MGKAIDRLITMTVVCENPSQTFLDSKEVCENTMKEAIEEMMVYTQEHDLMDDIRRVCEAVETPAQKFVVFLYANAVKIRTILSCRGVDESVPLSKELLEQYNIVDFFELYRIDEMIRQSKKSSEHIG